jgi:hypothetical protein
MRENAYRDCHGPGGETLRSIQLWTAAVALAIASACTPVNTPATSPAIPPAPDASQPAPAPTAQPAAAPSKVEFAPDIRQRLSRLPRTPIDYDRSLLDERERQVVDKLIEASRYIDEIFWRQVSEQNPTWRETLALASGTSPDAAAAYSWFLNMKGPWDRLEHFEPFVNVGPRPPGAGFYPTDITKEELERWIASQPQDKEAFQGLFTVIRRQGDRLVAIPYSQYYAELLNPAAAKLREAAALAENASLKDYLNKVADAFGKNDYYQSDFAWMDLDSDIEVVIGPYEVYEDELFNYKAAFESFVTVVDRPFSEKLTIYTKLLPEMEKNLPIPDEHKNPNRGAESPIKVVQEIFTAGDARRGVQTAAFNLPNDERVREAKGSKKVMLKNVMDAKYGQSGQPIAMRVLDPSQTSLVNKDAYFYWVVFHELTHGIGPGMIKTPSGERVDTRLLLKDTYSTIEEAKADVLGVWSLLFVMDRKVAVPFNAEQLFATVAGLDFRSMRFGLNEAHGRGTAIQWNYYREQGAIVPTSEGRFKVDFPKYRAAVTSLATELLMIEAFGDYERAKALIAKYGQSTPEIESVKARLTDIPIDIEPVFVAAGEKM